MPRPSGHVSLERALAQLGLASRTEVRALIQDGWVWVDGRPASDPLTPVVPRQVPGDCSGTENQRTGAWGMLKRSWK